MTLERYVAKILPKRGSRVEFQSTWWGILDCKLDEFVEVEGADGYEKRPVRFMNKEAAEYEARKRNLGMTWSDA